jgi:iron complex transport system ATP-binding protein
VSVVATDLCARLGGRDVLRGLDLAARAGEVTAIVGPNGSGKTTALRCLTGELPHEGAVTLDGTPIGDLAPHVLAARRAVLEQATPLAFPFPLAEVVHLGHRAGAEAADPTIPARALDAVGLRAKADRYFQSLPGGERQRAHLARILAQVWSPVLDGAPCWLFLDEPVAALDIAHQHDVMGIARRFADGGWGVVAVMHDLDLTAMVADHVVLISGGRVAAAGPVQAVIADAPLSAAYGCRVRVSVAPPNPFVLPHMAEAAA